MTLTTGHGSWFATPDLAYTYQWSLCDAAGDNCADIAGATDETYTLTGDAVMHTLRVTVTATNDLGQYRAQSGPSSLVGDVIVGTGGSELLRGTPGADTAKAFGGNDVLGLAAGNDLGHGGKGSDLLVGGAGADLLLEGRVATASAAAPAGIASSRATVPVTASHAGPGRDFVIADRRDFVAANCEIVRYW